MQPFKLIKSRTSHFVSLTISNVDSFIVVSFLLFKRRLGFSNCIFKVTHSPSHERVIVRFYGSALTGKGNKYKKLSEEEEVAIMNKLSQRNLAPRVIHAFQGGRIESFVTGRLITFDEIKSQSINHTIAKKLAQIHSMDNMLSKQEPGFNVEILFNFLDDFEKKRTVEAGDLSESDREIRSKILAFDVRREAEWIASLLRSVSSRIVFSHNDVHMKNIFVLEEQKDLLLMDYEYSGYNYRWADLANHLCEISLHSFDLSSGRCTISPLTRLERQAFCTVYLAEWMQQAAAAAEAEGKREEKSTLDTVEKLMMEVDFGFLVVHLMRVVFFTAYISTNFGPLQSWSYTALRLERYLQSKEEFIAEYGESVPQLSRVSHKQEAAII